MKNLTLLYFKMKNFNFTKMKIDRFYFDKCLINTIFGLKKVYIFKGIKYGSNI